MNSIGSLYFMANINVNWIINFDFFKKKIEKNTFCINYKLGQIEMNFFRLFQEKEQSQKNIRLIQSFL